MQGNGGSYSHTDEWTRYAWDFDLPLGSPVVAARAGVVIYARDESAIGGEDRERYLDESNMIIIDHRDGTQAIYMHLEKDGNRVQVGEWVLQGERIARSGDTGWAGSPHLHYTLRATRGRQSIASRFAGFSANEGVPREGDSVGPAPPPPVPQAVIDGVKAAWRTSREAERANLIGLAWELAADSPADPRHASYFHAQVVAAWRETLHLRVTERLQELAQTSAPNAAEMLEAQRWLVTVKRDNRTFKAQRKALAEAVRQWPAEARAWTGEIAAVKEWVGGLRKEYAGDRRAAIHHYRASLKKAGRRFKPTVTAALRRVFAHDLRVATRNFNRLDFEVDHARPEHQARLRADADATLETCKRLTRAWREIFRRDRNETRNAAAALDQARRRHRQILSRLGG